MLWFFLSFRLWIIRLWFVFFSLLFLLRFFGLFLLFILISFILLFTSFFAFFTLTIFFTRMRITIQTAFWLNTGLTKVDSSNNIFKSRLMTQKVDMSENWNNCFAFFTVIVESEKWNHHGGKGNISQSNSISNEKCMCRQVLINIIESRL